MKRLFQVLFIVLFLPAFALADIHLDKDEVRKKMWGDKREGFINYTVPEEWSNESAVILGKSMEYKAWKEPILAIIQEQVFFHERIMVMDKAAVETYTSRVFPIGYTKTYSYGNVYVGFKVIKRDGTEIIIDHTAAVERDLTNTNTSNQTLFFSGQVKELAIPNLEPGDILDYYIVFSESRSSSVTPAAYQFGTFFYELQGKYPIENQYLDLVLARKIRMNARGYNGAAKLERKKTEDKNTHYTLFQKKVDKYRGEVWAPALKTVPYLRLRCYYDTPPHHESCIPEDDRELKQSLTKNNIKEYIHDVFDDKKDYAKSLTKPTKKYIRRNFKHEEDLKKLAREIYYHFRFNYYQNRLESHYGRKDYDILSHKKFIGSLTWLFDKFDIPYEYYVTVPNAICDISDAIIPTDLTYVVKTGKTAPLYFGDFTRYSLVNDLPEHMQGNHCYVIRNAHEKDKHWTITDGYLPSSESDQNIQENVMLIEPRLDENILEIQRKLNLNGLAKTREQYLMVNNEYEENEGSRERYGYTAYADRLDPESRGEKDKIERFHKDIKNYEQKRLTAAKDYFDSDYEEEIDSVYALEVNSLGIWEENPVFSFTTDYSVPGLIQRAGPNYLLSAGKLISRQVALDEEDMKERRSPVYIGFPKKYVYNIKLNIPEGYTVKGLDKLRYNVDNESGKFISTAELVDNALIIKTEKEYKKGKEKAENWPLMVDFLEAAYEFTQQKVLLEKEGL